MADVLALYWNPSTTPQHHIYGLAPATLADEPEAREDGLPSVMMLVPTTFVWSWIADCSAEDAAWTGLAPGTATIEGQDDMDAAWFQGQGLYRAQADGEELFVYLLNLADQWQTRLVESEEQGRALVPDGVPFPSDMQFAFVETLFDLVP
jgi:hypothetical protein